MTQSIAIVGMACRYADVHSPQELWDNGIAKRQAFRLIPDERLRVEDYASPRAGKDSIDCCNAAVLEDFEFDRARFCVSGQAFRSSDMTHWLALEVAAQALEDAHLASMHSDLRERSSVYIGNSLTGEFSRSNILRLRWPFVRRVIEATLLEHGIAASELMERMEYLYKSPFPETTEESLAGGLSNTISGRISNHFDFKGGAYTVDGACASSLISVATACSALAAGDVDVALAGGVDLSLDPFELAGFSRLGALARQRMRVFDEHSSGFWPGEGCGIVVLMRNEEALKRNLPVRAILRGWGISSDGSGGITRPELAGQLLAIKRAYERAGYGSETVGYFEAHGTGTTVGDATELAALVEARCGRVGKSFPAVVSTIKANIGHTKAAAGIAGLIRAVMAVEKQILPPLTSCERPHALLRESKHALRVLDQAELWPSDWPLRAGVSAMGFGGINVHVTLESECTKRRTAFTRTEEMQLAGEQDCELFLFEAEDPTAMRAWIARLKPFSAQLSNAELTDLSMACAQRIDGKAGLRAAIVVSDPKEFQAALSALDSLLVDGRISSLDNAKGVFLGARSSSPRIGFLFPGQGSPLYPDGGIWARRFPSIRSLYRDAGLAPSVDVATEFAQPNVCTSSLAGLKALKLAGIQASVAIGHSLGELTAFHWAGSFDSSSLLNLARARGQAIGKLHGPLGAMASIGASPKDVERLKDEQDVAIAALNSPRQTVISGPASAVEAFLNRARAAGFSAFRLAVSHAFHSPLIEPARASLYDTLADMTIGPLQRDIISTVTGTRIASDEDLRTLLISQLTSPVRFHQAIVAAEGIDLFIEVGPGSALSRIASDCVSAPAISLDAGGSSLRGLLLATGAAFAMGKSIDIEALFAGRFCRPINLDFKRHFLQNPCESFRPSGVAGGQPEASKDGTVRGPQPSEDAAPPSSSLSALDVLRALVARRTELPLSEVNPGSRFLVDLHLNSIAVSQIVLEAARTIGAAAPAAPAEYADVALEKAAEALEELRSSTSVAGPAPDLDGIAVWTRMATVEWVESVPRHRLAKGALGEWDIFAEPEDPLGCTLRREFCNCTGQGIVCCIPAVSSGQELESLLDYTQRALAQRPPRLIYVFRNNPMLGSFARSVWLEHPEIAMSVIHVPPEDDRTPGWAKAEAAVNTGFVECSYDSSGIRREPRLNFLPAVESHKTSWLSAQDILLVSGGGKGIAAESALTLARNSHCRIVLMGRSNPDRDRGLKLNLRRFALANIEFRYEQADVTDIAAVRRTLQSVQDAWGPITAVLHGAGANSPKRIETVTIHDIRNTIAPKVDGLKNILSSIDATRLSTLVTFGSIIARTGMQGEAEYALANASLAVFVEEWKTVHPHCKCLNLEWSVWAGTGMGQRLGVIDSLKQQGIIPISIDEGMRILQTALDQTELPTSTIVTSRTGNLGTLRLKEAELPFLRFVDQACFHFPGVELVVEAELGVSNDPYLDDHALEGERVFPAVMGMEAMAQVAVALYGRSELPRFRALKLRQPIVVGDQKPLRIRIAALQQAPGQITVAIRSASTSFQVDHFEAECAFGNHALQDQPSIQGGVHGQQVAINPDEDLYSGVLFHQGRFRRVRSYRKLAAHHSVADISPAPHQNWFGRHFPQMLLLGDPAARDAVIHSVQACIPQAPLMPISVEAITLNNQWAEGPVEVRAKERGRDNEAYVYDLEVVDGEGRVRERWDGIRFQTVKCADRRRSLMPALLLPFLERGFEETLGSFGLRMAIENGTRDRAMRAARVASALTEGRSCLQHRLDGRPVLGRLADTTLSIAHTPNLTFAVTSPVPIGCDLEPVVSRKDEDWKLLLGPKGWELAEFVAGEMAETKDTSATRVWAARESLRKIGSPLGQTLLCRRDERDGWLNYCAGSKRGACCIVSVRGERDPLVFALVTEKSHARI